MTIMNRKILWMMTAALLGCDAPPERREVVRSATPEVPGAAPVVLFLGTSLTAGLGVGEDRAYPALVQEKIDSVGLRYRVLNAGVSGETSAGGLRRIDWLLKEPVAVLVIELGANDALRGHPPEAVQTNLQEIIDRTERAHPDTRIVIAGMEAPPNLGDRYTRAFRQVFVNLAHDNDATLIGFLLEGVAGVSEFNQEDGIHPTAEGHRRMAETVWEVLEPVLREISSAGSSSPGP